jgi:hypothetical protein
MTAIRITIGLLIGVVLLRLPAAAAETAQTEVQVTVEEIMHVTFTGGSTICFDVDKGGEITVYNTGDLNWTTNYPQWQIEVKRTLWTYEGDEDGFDPEDDDMVLKLRADDPTHDDWREVGLTPMVWILGEGTGSGTMPGVDWKAFNTMPKIRPKGMYCVTVTFTIQPQT